jgi:hypothetical protein
MPCGQLNKRQQESRKPPHGRVLHLLYDCIPVRLPAVLQARLHHVARVLVLRQRHDLRRNAANDCLPAAAKLEWGVSFKTHNADDHYGDQGCAKASVSMSQLPAMPAASSAGTARMPCAIHDKFSPRAGKLVFI